MEILTLENLAALFTLTALEIVLGIDNIIFIAILVERLETALQAKARRIGLMLAMAMRILLLLAISWIMQLTQPWFSVFGRGFTGRDVILLAGGLFLIAKATHEIHAKFEEHEALQSGANGRRAKFGAVLVQIMLLDIVFSLDSVITAVGMAQQLSIMITAVVVAVGVMMFFAGSISTFINRHPTFKMLALSFLLLIGVVLVADGLGRHIDKAYIYFAMGFSFFVEFLNMRTSRRPQHA